MRPVKERLPRGVSWPQLLIDPELPLKLLNSRGTDQLLLVAIVQALLDEAGDTEREDGREDDEGRDGQHIRGETITVAAPPRWKAGRV